MLADSLLIKRMAYAFQRLPGKDVLGCNKVHGDMLEFAAHHSIKPTIETFELSAAGIEAAFDKLKAGSMRYRGVLEYVHSQLGVKQ